MPRCKLASLAVQVFLSTHIVGFIGFVAFLEMHCPSSLYYMPGLALYFLDVAFRIAQWRVTSGMQCTFVSADRSFVSLKLRFNKVSHWPETIFVHHSDWDMGKGDCRVMGRLDGSCTRGSHVDAVYNPQKIITAPCILPARGKLPFSDASSWNAVICIAR